MPYCKLGEKPIIKYKFPDKPELTYTSKNAPIEIIVRETKLTGYMPGAYQADYYLDIYSSTGAYSSTIHYEPYPPNTSNQTLINTPNKYYYPPFDYPIPIRENGLSSICCDYSDSTGKRFRGYFNLGGFHERNAIGRYVIRDIKWVREDGKAEAYKWEIEIIDNKGKVFKDYGVDKPSFKVQCGKCPDGFLECCKTGYPGYCCIPCNEIKAELVAAKKELKRLNNG